MISQRTTTKARAIFEHNTSAGQLSQFSSLTKAGHPQQKRELSGRDVESHSGSQIDVSGTSTSSLHVWLKLPLNHCIKNVLTVFKLILHEFLILVTSK